MRSYALKLSARVKEASSRSLYRDRSIPPLLSLIVDFPLYINSPLRGKGPIRYSFRSVLRAYVAYLKESLFKPRFSIPRAPSLRSLFIINTSKEALYSFR